MSIAILLEMPVSMDPDKEAIVDGDLRLTLGQVDALVNKGAARITESGAQCVAYVGTGGAAMPVLLFASARAGVPFAPLNYRLTTDALVELIERLPGAVVIADAEYKAVAAQAGVTVLDSAQFLDVEAAADAQAPAGDADPDALAVVLFTSGTTSKPKAVEITHANLTSYVMGTVDFASADPADAALICVPPYHIAGVSAALSNLYAGRRAIYLQRFDPAAWLQLVHDEGVTNATVVPTMLDRIIAAYEKEPVELPTLRNLAYGGSKVPQPLVRRTLDLLGHVGLVNAYGLTETSSTIAVLGPDDHREAYVSDDPAIARRLGSVGRAVPGIELQIRDADGTVLGADGTGELFIRGPQVSGKYTGIGSVLDAEGWFPTKDVASIDADGYLFIGGRSDDTIIRGGENIAPAEVEDVLVEHPRIRDVVAVGVPDPEWGQAIVAVVVREDGVTDADLDAEAVRDFARTRLRGSRTPDHVVFRDELPSTATGKILRRVLVDELTPAAAE
ncbi:AMP-binding protein [Gordonia amarae]|uniref:AMP-binding protein n=2 Tax=Gordonia amarae TaxID=36821 RepID=A0A857L2R1_9ACTN|nr:class I adenylate-forming enzyme family protein [Gordonia amarae]MCS3880714.1 acyl-CoA synthetase (AMP-forming)/AMP-acid ligase II [Gordonia amarae]QHN19009.1 AMP-binding protein [Gordonia amarae]QHN23484.1 AMP-binding protein [Gordonia amarae]QHN32384.1 AMP-binding protein [Gordonia amarae]QHN41132.1 AMP-binding protein [Gordonia amarae]